MKQQVVVIGSGVGGLSAAIHARLSGHDVLVVEQHERPGGKAASIQQSGYRLDPGPSIVILREFYEDVFKRAGKRMDDYLEFSRLDPFTRVYFEGDSALDLPADRTDCLKVLCDRFPEDAQAFHRLMTRLDRAIKLVRESIFRRPYDQPWKLMDWRLLAMGRTLGVPGKYKSLIDSWFKSPLIRAFFYGFPSYGGQTYDSVAPGALFIPYLMIAEGVYYPKGGVAAIPDALYRLALDLGVEFRFRTRVTGMALEKGRVKTVETVQGDFSCSAAICNLDRLAAGAWLGRSYTYKPSLSYFTAHWGVKRRVEGLSHHTLFVPRDFQEGFESLYRHRRFPESPIVYMNATHIVDPPVAPPGCSNLFAVATSPAVEEGLDWKGEEGQALRAVKKTLARFGYDLPASDLEFERIQTPAYFQEAHGNYKGSLYGPDEQFRLFGMMPLRNWDEEVPNLFYCGASVQPGAGLPMVVLSGKFVAERLNRM